MLFFFKLRTNYSTTLDLTHVLRIKLQRRRFFEVALNVVVQQPRYFEIMITRPRDIKETPC